MGAEWTAWKGDPYALDDGLVDYTSSRSGTFHLFLIAVPDDEEITTAVRLGQHRHAWSTFPRTKCSDREWLTRHVNQALGRVMLRLQHPGQTLPPGISVVYPTYHVSISLL